MKDGLSCFDEGLKRLCLIVFDALFVDLEVHYAQDLRDNFTGVFEADTEAVLLCLLGQEFDEVNRVGLRQT